MTNTDAMGRDLELIDLVEAIGGKKAKAAASRQRRAIFAELANMNKRDGLDAMTDDEILAELTA